MDMKVNIQEVERIIFNLVIEAKTKVQSDLPYIFISEHAQNRHKLNSYQLFLGCRSLMDKGLITDDITIGNGFFEYFGASSRAIA